jgi:hypothetical protein
VGLKTANQKYLPLTKFVVCHGLRRLARIKRQSVKIRVIRGKKIPPQAGLKIKLLISR